MSIGNPVKALAWGILKTRRIADAYKFLFCFCWRTLPSREKFYVKGLKMTKRHSPEIKKKKQYNLSMNSKAQRPRGRWQSDKIVGLIPLGLRGWNLKNDFLIVLTTII